MNNKIVSEIGNCINKGTCWIIKSLYKQYFIVTQYFPLNARSYTELPEELRIWEKGLINIKILDNKYFLNCQLAKLNEDKVKSHAERVSIYKKYVDIVNYNVI